MTWFKAIAGNDSFYVVQKAFKFEPSPEQLTQWLGYLNKVSVCDTRLPERQVPGGDEVELTMRRRGWRLLLYLQL